MPRTQGFLVIVGKYSASSAHEAQPCILSDLSHLAHSPLPGNSISLIAYFGRIDLQATEIYLRGNTIFIVK
jgi:hypothetical protein